MGEVSRLINENQSDNNPIKEGFHRRFEASDLEGFKG